MSHVRILNIDIDNLSMDELLHRLQSGGFVVTPNVDHLIKLQRDREFYKLYQEADYRVCDSQVVFYSSRFLGHPLRERISGSDLFPCFYRYYQGDPSMTIFLLGAGPGVADRAREKINQRVQRNMVVAAYSPSFGFEQNKEECDRIVELINQSGATVLAIGVGAPKQEKWVAQYRQRLTGVKVFLAIGATIDFEAGQVSRAPRWMSNWGVEWVYRILQQPKRLWRRYLIDDLPFLWLLVQQRFGLYRNPMA
ncbi:WecB/TagA/CpsF family glycosyltransferase [Prochlorothrix hollandica]|uniref:WecB/TagA/CpsF family glycosyltransferase n=1 Tax=Prochlorothrix hollandica TaxID=1223 RepID=UPI00333F04D3